MTSSSPPEAPHYNGKTLSPASPKPIHIPDLDSIPVLQNQIDPVFNLVTSHMATPSSAEQSRYPPAPQDVLATSPPSFSADDTPAVNGEHVSLTQSVSQNDNLLQDNDIFNVIANDDPNNQQASSLEPNESATAHATSNHASLISKQHQPAIAPDNAALSMDISTSPTDTHTMSDHAASVASHGAAQISAKSPIQGLNIDTGNIQALLDNLIASASSNAPAPGFNSTTAPQASSPADSQTPISALPTPAGLPPRPPPQDEPSIHSNYAPGQSLRSYHNSSSNTAQIQNAQTHSSYPSDSNHSAANTVGPNGLPPPPAATFQQPSNPSQPTPQEFSLQQQANNVGTPLAALPPLHTELQNSQPADDQEQAYQDFLRAEASYVADGTWDRFPHGSRLFVGNLFTEKVSKRNIWDIFSHYGSLAQISMKNAYGFVQFIDPGVSSRAMRAEEGTELGGRKIHLEISKPQKNTRNANTGDRARGGYARRSRSPDHPRGSGYGGQQRPGSSSFNTYERRGRDDYRPMRSPSPRGARGFDNRGVDRYVRRLISKSRSPYGNRRVRSRSPLAREIDDEAQLPIPRRNPVQVPDVQIIIVDESDRTFVAYIQQSFRDRGLRCEVQQLPRGFTLQAVVRRQIIEGVQAVVKIYRKSQVTGKVPLQVFDRTGGLNNVRFDEYEELDASTAADVVIRGKSSSMNPTPMNQQYPQNQNYSQAQQPHGQPPAHHGQQQHFPQQQMPAQPPNANAGMHNPLSSLDGATLQKLLSSVNQGSPTTPTFPNLAHAGQAPQDLAALLSTVSRQTPQLPTQSGYHPPQHTPTQQGFPPYQQAGQSQQQAYPPQNPQASAAAFASSPALAQLLGRAQQGTPQQGGYQHPQQHGPPPQQQNVQDIMAQLAKYRQ